MQPVSIRDAEANDAADIATIRVYTWQYAYKGLLPDRFLNNLSIEEHTAKWEDRLANPQPQTEVLVAAIEGKVIGYCWVGTSDDDASERTGQVYAIYVDADYMGRGAGSVLLEESIKRFRRNGWEQATLWVLTNNLQARGFYERRGWVSDGKVETRRRDGANLHGMRYSINLRIGK